MRPKRAPWAHSTTLPQTTVPDATSWRTLIPGGQRQPIFGACPPPPKRTVAPNECCEPPVRDGNARWASDAGATFDVNGQPPSEYGSRYILHQSVHIDSMIEWSLDGTIRTARRPRGPRASASSSNSKEMRRASGLHRGPKARAVYQLCTSSGWVKGPFSGLNCACSDATRCQDESVRIQSYNVPPSGHGGCCNTRPTIVGLQQTIPDASVKQCRN